jgi:hypothetical protein
MRHFTTSMLFTEKSQCIPSSHHTQSTLTLVNMPLIASVPRSGAGPALGSVIRQEDHKGVLFDAQVAQIGKNATWGQEL